jgi:hypothetical protein
MSVFGPLYPPALQAAVSHAERFSHLLGEAEALHAPTDALGRAWLLGRTEEIETVLGCIVEDWKAGRLTPDGAASAVTAYLTALHVGAQRTLGLRRVAPCCEDGDAITLRPVTHDAETRLIPRIDRIDRSTHEAAETLFDPRAILDRLDEEARPRPPSCADVPPGVPVARSKRLSDPGDD